MAKRFPIRTALAGLTVLAVSAPVIAPVSDSFLASAVAQAMAQQIKLTGPESVAINTAGTFVSEVPEVTDTGTVQFYLDGVPVDEPVQVSGGTASKSITPSTYTADSFKHTVTARYIDEKGTNPNPDGTATFTTPVDIKEKINTARDYENYSNFRVGPTEANLAVSSLADPVVIEAGSKYFLAGTMTVAGGRSDICLLYTSPSPRDS